MTGRSTDVRNFHRIGRRYAEVDRRITAVLRHQHRLNDTEIEFLTRLQDNLDRYAEATYISAKQLNWLLRIEQDVL